MAASPRQLLIGWTLKPSFEELHRSGVSVQHNKSGLLRHASLSSRVVAQAQGEMASPDLPDADDIFAKLQKPVDPSRQDQQNKRLQEQVHNAQRRVEELIGANATLPTTISSVSVLNAPHTRRAFLSRLVSPILSANNDEQYTLNEALRRISSSAAQLEKLDIFHSPILTYVDRPDPTDPNSTPNDLSVFFSVREKSRLVASSGTWAGSNDGSVYFNLLLRNIFGGAESFNANASYGTRTKSSYSAGFDTPVFSNPDVRFEVGGLASSTQKTWASHEEAQKGGFARLKWLTPTGHRHEVAYNGIWRQITGLAEAASPTVRADAGNSVKSAISYAWTLDRRDNPLLPTRGYLLKTTSEVAGFGPLGGDATFSKVEFDSQAAIPVPIPFVKGESGVSLTAGLRGGLIYPLGHTAGDSQPSRINDRFLLGGPTDVRGFRLAGLGPRDGQDAVGGDLYAAGGASLLLPFPRVARDTPLRFQLFINGGRLLAHQNARAGSEKGDRKGPVQSDIRQSFSELSNGLPSTAIGLGVVYAMPVARFELNFTLPLVVRQGEEARKGISLGVGLNFL